MSEKIADDAVMIVGGFAFNIDERGFYRVLNLYNTDEACVLDKDGDVVATDMNELRTLYVQGLYLKNRELLEED